MTTEVASSSTALKSRVVGMLLVCIGGGFLYYFIQAPTGSLPGFAQIWRGGPFLLGASFFSITGFFLILQKRFSLGAFFVAGFVSAALTTASHVFVRSIREVTTIDLVLNVAADDQKVFVARSRAQLTAERFRRFVEDADAHGWLRGGIDFEEVYVTFGTVPREKDKLVVTLNIETCPYVHPLPGYARHIVEQYSTFAHLWIAQSLDENIETPDELGAALARETEKDGYEHALNLLVSLLVDSGGRLRVSTSTYSQSWIRERRQAVVWLRDQEPNAELKAYWSKMLDAMDKLSPKNL